MVQPVVLLLSFCCRVWQRRRYHSLVHLCLLVHVCECLFLRKGAKQKWKIMQRRKQEQRFEHYQYKYHESNIFAVFIFIDRDMKATQAILDKLSAIVHEAAYLLRYERGTFQSGWCLLEQKRVIVLNKFLDTEGRINTLLELIPQLPIDVDKLTHESQKLYAEIQKEAAQHNA